MEQVPGSVNPQALWRSSKLVGKWLGADVESIGNFSSSGVADAPAQVAQDQQLITGVSNHLKSQPVNNAPAATGLDTPARNSAALINTTGANTTQFKSGGGVDDLWVVEKNAGRYVGTREQFRADFVASNGQVNPKTLVVQQNQTYFVPQRSANGNTTYHYSNGAVVTNNAVSGEYRMVVNNTEGGGQTVYTRSLSSTGGYTVTQVQTNGAGQVVYDFKGQQSSLSAPLIPVNTKVVNNQQTTTHTYLANNVVQTDTFMGPPAPSSRPSVAPSTSTVTIGNKSYDLLDIGSRNDAEYGLYSLKQTGGLNNSGFNSVTLSNSQFLLGGSAGSAGSSFGVKVPSNNNYLNPFPIGAFYDSQSTAFDNAASVARSTARAMNASGQALSAAQLAARDTGSTRADNLWGGKGNDTLYGYAGDDKLYGEDGNDFLQGDAGNDCLWQQAA
jgi:hypothetical protein